MWHCTKEIEVRVVYIVSERLHVHIRLARYWSWINDPWMVFRDVTSIKLIDWSFEFKRMVELSVFGAHGSVSITELLLLLIVQLASYHMLQTAAFWFTERPPAELDGFLFTRCNISVVFCHLVSITHSFCWWSCPTSRVFMLVCTLVCLSKQPQIRCSLTILCCGRYSGCVLSLVSVWQSPL